MRPRRAAVAAATAAFGVAAMWTPLPVRPAAALNDQNCVDFPSQAAAEQHLRSDPTDPDNLDTNRNGIACEGSPGPFDRERRQGGRRQPGRWSRAALRAVWDAARATRCRPTSTGVRLDSPPSRRTRRPRRAAHPRHRSTGWIRSVQQWSPLRPANQRRGCADGG